MSWTFFSYKNILIELFINKLLNFKVMDVNSKQYIENCIVVWNTISKVFVVMINQVLGSYFPYWYFKSNLLRVSLVMLRWYFRYWRKALMKNVTMKTMMRRYMRPNFFDFWFWWDAVVAFVPVGISFVASESIDMVVSSWSDGNSSQLLDVNGIRSLPVVII